MRLLSLDYDPVFGEGATRASFGSDVSVFDHDAVIWDPAGSYESYTRYADTYQSLPCLSDDTSVRIRADARRRRNEFIEFVEAGKTVVVVVRPPQVCYVSTGEVKHSGTGRNARSTRIVVPFDLLQAALPLDDPGFEKARGDRIEIIGDGALPNLLRKYKTFLYYAATMSKAPGTAIGKVAGTTRVVASFMNSKSRGCVIFLPVVEFEPEDAEDDPDDAQVWPNEASQFQNELLQAVQTLSGSEESPRPAWAENYSTPEQRSLRTSIQQQRLSVERARAKLAGLQGKAEAAQARDQLFLGTGRPLELQVRVVLEMLGGTVHEPEPGRDDWRVTFPEGLCVVEVKGVGKSAGEKHAAQLEKWVAEAFQATGVLPKGILIVNTWRNLPLADRTEDDFPAQMLPYSIGRGHCLITGLELFLIAGEIAEDPSRAEYWRSKIMQTQGRLEEVPDWRTILEESIPAAT